MFFSRSPFFYPPPMPLIVSDHWSYKSLTNYCLNLITCLMSLNGDNQKIIQEPMFRPTPFDYHTRGGYVPPEKLTVNHGVYSCMEARAIDIFSHIHAPERAHLVFEGFEGITRQEFLNTDKWLTSDAAARLITNFRVKVLPDFVLPDGFQVGLRSMEYGAFGIYGVLMRMLSIRSIMRLVPFFSRQFSNVDTVKTIDITKSDAIFSHQTVELYLDFFGDSSFHENFAGLVAGAPLVHGEPVSKTTIVVSGTTLDQRLHENSDQKIRYEISAGNDLILKGPHVIGKFGKKGPIEDFKHDIDPRIVDRKRGLEGIFIDRAIIGVSQKRKPYVLVHPGTFLPDRRTPAIVHTRYTEVPKWKRIKNFMTAFTGYAKKIKTNKEILIRTTDELAYQVDFLSQKLNRQKLENIEADITLKNETWISVIETLKVITRKLHDLNNIECGVVSYTDLALMGLRASRNTNKGMNAEKVDTIHDYLVRANSSRKEVAISTEQLQGILRDARDEKRSAMNIKPFIHRIVHSQTLNLKQYNKIKERLTILVDVTDKVIFGNEESLEAALLNLVSNSFDAMMEKRGMAEIRIKIEENSDYHILRYRDSGKGMTEAQKTAFFSDQRYTSKQPGSGTGYGSENIKQAAEIHKGFIEISSQTGIDSYTEFKIHLRKEEPEQRLIGKLKELEKKIS